MFVILLGQEAHDIVTEELEDVWEWCSSRSSSCFSNSVYASFHGTFVFFLLFYFILFIIIFRLLILFRVARITIQHLLGQSDSIYCIHIPWHGCLSSDWYSFFRMFVFFIYTL